ncbi:hypothetical protein V8G54_025236 [Vigna mungo]|uniref:Uncharacterized protein n=1 Tax=Vigna mungo TaxID=3915 RepID=A0AAQ3N7S2_VIGMU
MNIFSGIMLVPINELIMYRVRLTTFIGRYALLTVLIIASMVGYFCGGLIAGVLTMVMHAPLNKLIVMGVVNMVLVSIGAKYGVNFQDLWDWAIVQQKVVRHTTYKNDL